MKSDWFAYSDPRRWGHFEEEDRGRRAAVAQTGAAIPRKREVPPAGAAQAGAKRGAGSALLTESKAQRGPDSSGLSRADAARTASAMALDLAGQSRAYPGIDWAVGVYDDAGSTSFYAASNEGAGFLPLGMKWDKRLQHVLGPVVPDKELGPWLGLANPARILAEHFLLLRSKRPGLKLVSLVSTENPGEAVALMRTMLCAAGPSSTGTSVEAGERAATRLDAVDDGRAAAVVASIPHQERWAAGLALAHDAARECGFHKQDQQLWGVLESLRAGRADAKDLRAAEHAGARFTEQAQARRVPDTRLGLIDLYSDGPTFGEAVALSAGSDYAQPFFAARVCCMIAVLLYLRLADSRMGKGHLSELAYEHVCVAEDLRSTRTVLARHSANAVQAR